jgi:hypothetical protein
VPRRALANRYEQSPAVNDGSCRSVLTWPFGVGAGAALPRGSAFQARDAGSIPVTPLHRPPSCTARGTASSGLRRPVDVARGRSPTRTHHDDIGWLRGAIALPVHDTLRHVDEIARTGLNDIRATRPELHPQRTSEDIGHRSSSGTRHDDASRTPCRPRCKQVPTTCRRWRRPAGDPFPASTALPSVARSHNQDLILALTMPTSFR